MTTNKKLSAHFSASEFRCKCGCGREDINTTLVVMLEKLRDALNAKAIIVSSGVRCPQHDKAVGGSGNGMHTLGGAADICAQKQDGSFYTSLTICEQAERIGFNGVAVIDDTYAHVDIRGIIKYVNNHWFGDERDSSKVFKTFKGLGERIAADPSKTINAIIEIEDHKYSGLLSEI